MNTINEIFENYQKTLNVVKYMSEANNGNYEVYFDENLWEVTEDEIENGENYKYTSSDISIITDMLASYYNKLVSSIELIGYKINCPYNDSIYIYKNEGSKAISLRDHDVANSTRNHWDEIYAVNIYNGNITEEILKEYLN